MALESQRRCADVEACVLEAEEEEDTLDEVTVDHRRYTPFKAVMDSGAGEHVCGAKCAPTIPIRPSAGSRRGQRYVAANGGRLPNEGEQYMRMWTTEGTEADMIYQVAEVKRPLCSISRLCDRGNRVIFGSGGGVIHNLRTGNVTPFSREGGVYVLETLVDSESGQPTGFHRLGY